MDPANDQPAQNTDNRPSAIPNRGSTGVGGRQGLHFEAAIFDMDGVVTNTSAAHSGAWKQTFDDFLKQSSAAGKLPADTDKEALFKQFKTWEAEQNARAQAPAKPKAQ